LFLHEKTVNVLLRILEAEDRGEEVYPLSISKDIGSPYSYVSKVLGEFEREAIIDSEYVGRTRIVKLTESGRELAEKLRELKKILSKDFVSRKKLTLLENFVREYENLNFSEIEAVFAYAPILAELEEIINHLEQKDAEAYEQAKQLMKSVECRLKENVK